MNPIVLYRNLLSGHAHRVELFCSLLQLPVRLVDVDLRGGEHKKPEFLRKNPFGQVPVIEDGDVTLADSNAILVYLAGRYDKTGSWYPRDPLAAARVQQWLSVAAGQLAAGPRSDDLAQDGGGVGGITQTGQLGADGVDALGVDPAEEQGQDDWRQPRALPRPRCW